MAAAVAALAWGLRTLTGGGAIGAWVVGTVILTGAGWPGAAAVPLAFGEVYTALQAGVLDGVEHDPPTIVASKFYETSKFYSLTQHNFSPLAIYFSDATYKRMDAKVRDRFLAVTEKAAADTRAHGLAVEKEALELLKSKGVSIKDCDKPAFQKRVAPQTESFLKQNPGAKPVVDKIKSTTA